MFSLIAAYNSTQRPFYVPSLVVRKGKVPIFLHLTAEKRNAASHGALPPEALQSISPVSTPY